MPIPWLSTMPGPLAYPPPPQADIASYYQVEPVAQRGLVWNGQPTWNGCVPAGISTITGYWSGQGPAWQTHTPQEYLDANADMFGPGGVSASHFTDDLDALGYDTVPRVNASLDELRDEVRQGPVLAYVRLGMEPEGVSHVVAVTGMSDKEVTVVDPWDAAEKTYPVEQFKASWDTDFGQGRHRNYLAIRPRQPEEVPQRPPWRARGRRR